MFDMVQTVLVATMAAGIVLIVRGLLGFLDERNRRRSSFPRRDDAA